MMKKVLMNGKMILKIYIVIYNLYLYIYNGNYNNIYNIIDGFNFYN
jgi:hypothetical protein